MKNPFDQFDGPNPFDEFDPPESSWLADKAKRAGRSLVKMPGQVVESVGTAADAIGRAVRGAGALEAGNDLGQSTPEMLAAMDKQLRAETAGTGMAKATGRQMQKSLGSLYDETPGMQPDPKRDRELFSQAADSVGSLAGAMVTPGGILPKTIVGALLNSQGQADEARQIQEKRGAPDPETDAIVQFVANLPAGALESIPWANALKRFGGANLAKAVSEKFGKDAFRRISTAVFGQAAAEAGEEGLQQLWGNATAKLGYDPERKLTEGVGEAMAVGGLMGGGLGGGLQVTAEVANKLDTGKNIPEGKKTLEAQQEQLQAGRRPAQMFPLGTPELTLPKGMERVETPRGVFHYDPRVLTADDVLTASKLGRENEILALGPVAKPEADARAAAGEARVATTERAADGTEIKTALGTTATAAAQAAALEQSKSPGSTVQVEPVDQAVKQRPGGAQFLQDILAKEAKALAEQREAAAKEVLEREQRQKELDQKKALFDERIGVARQTFAKPDATYGEVKGALESVTHYAEDNSLGLTQDQRIAAGLAQAALAKREATMRAAEEARQESERAAKAAAAAVEEEARQAKIRQDKLTVKAQQQAGIGASGAFDYQTAPMAALEARAEQGDERAQEAIMRRTEAENDDRPDLLAVLRQVKLPTSDAALGAELSLILTEGMTPQQRRELTSNKKDSLDRTAEALREQGFSWIQTPADVIDAVQQALRGNRVMPDRQGGVEGVDFATGEQAEMEISAPNLPRDASQFQRDLTSLGERFNRLNAGVQTNRDSLLVGLYAQVGRRLQAAIQNQTATVDPTDLVEVINAVGSDTAAAALIMRAMQHARGWPSVTAEFERGAISGGNAGETVAERAKKKDYGRLVDITEAAPSERFLNRTDKRTGDISPFVIRAATRNELKLALGKDRATINAGRSGQREIPAAALVGEAMDNKGTFLARMTDETARLIFDRTGETPESFWKAVRQGDPALVNRLAQTPSARRNAFKKAGRYVGPLAITTQPESTGPRPLESQGNLELAAAPRTWRDLEATTPAKIDAELAALRQAFPELAATIDVEIGDPAAALRRRGSTSDVPNQVQAAMRPAQDGWKTLIVLAARAYRDRAKGAALFTHELAHVYWNTLPAASQERLRALHAEEVRTKTGPLYRDGQLQTELSFVEDQDERGHKEWFAERIARLNEAWAKGKIDHTEASILRAIAYRLREFLRRIWSAMARSEGTDPQSKLFKQAFREFIASGAQERVGQEAGATFARESDALAKTTAPGESVTREEIESYIDRNGTRPEKRGEALEQLQAIARLAENEQLSFEYGPPVSANSRHGSGGTPDPARGRIQRAATALTAPLQPDALRAAFGDGDRITSIFPELVRDPMRGWDIRGAVIKTSADMAMLCQILRSPYVETSKLAFVNEAGEVVHSQIMGIGSVNAAIMDPKMLARLLAALPNEGRGLGVYLSHNHPGGDPLPSLADNKVTKGFSEALAKAGIPLLDHVVTNGLSFYSFWQQGLVKLGGAVTETEKPKAQGADLAEIKPLGTKPGWENVPRLALHQLSHPKITRSVLEMLRQVNPEAFHIVYLNQKSRVTGLERILDKKISPTEIFRQIFAGIGREGAALLAVDAPANMPAPQAMLFLRELRQWSADAGVTLLDYGSATALPDTTATASGLNDSQATFDLGGAAVGIDLPPTIRNLQPRWQSKVLDFESSLDRALYYAGGEGNTSTRDSVVASLAQQTGLTAGRIASLARELRGKLGTLARAAAADARITVPPQMAAAVAKETGTEFAQGKPDILTQLRDKTVSLTADENGEAVKVEMNAAEAWSETQQNLATLRKLADCLTK